MTSRITDIGRVDGVVLRRRRRALLEWLRVHDREEHRQNDDAVEEPERRAEKELASRNHRRRRRRRACVHVCMCMCVLEPITNDA